MKNIYVLLLLSVVALASAHAQLITPTSTASQNNRPPFYDEIQGFKKQDSISTPPQKVILFTGSSSIRVWGDIQKYFPGYPVLNRGFGGSTLLDVIRYADDIIFPYKPKQIVIYCGENDMVDTVNVNASVVTDRVKQLITLLRFRINNPDLLYISIKPSPSRAYLMPRMAQANAMIEAYIKTVPNAKFIPVYNAMLDANGQPRKELFTNDMLHMNSNGYALWQRIVKPYLIR